MLADVGRARDADGLYVVVGASGSEYLVDADEGACECGDFRFREVECKHLQRVAFATGQRAIPAAAAVELDVDPTLGDHVEGDVRVAATDGGVGADGAADDSAADDESADDEGGTWILRDRDRDRARAFDSRAEAEATKADLEALGVDVALLPRADASADSSDAAAPAPAEDAQDRRVRVLEERTVDEDPLELLPDAFVDWIDGTPAINRKGFEVLAHFYDVDVETEVQVGPEETDFEYCRVEATATTPSGRRCEALGSAHVDRDDDPNVLLELADTRARKRALSIATGMGMLAVDELRSEVAEE